MLYYHKNIEIIATCNCGKNLLDSLTKLQPDVLLLDVQLPDITGNELARIISKKYPAIAIIALTSLDNTYYVKDMLQHGCKGYLEKTASQETILQAIEQVHQGNIYLEQKTKTELLNEVIKAQKKNSNIPVLTRREKEVLQLIVADYSNKQIADKLFLSERTIENHRFNLQQKLNVKTPVGLMKIAMQMGLIE